MQSLAELTTQSAKIGQWTLRVCGEPYEHEYKFRQRGIDINGKVLHCRLVSEDSSQYCIGKFKRKGKEPDASALFASAKQKFKDQSIWKVSKVSLTNDKALYNGAPIKVVIDMNATVMQPVLQSTVSMPSRATPHEGLATVLESPNNQRVDVLALIVSVERERAATTPHGQRKIVDVTIRDHSGDAGASECEFTIFFKDSQAGLAELAAFRIACSDGVPVALFNLVVTAGNAQQKSSLKPSLDGFMWETCRVGEKAQKLLEGASALKNRAAEQVTRVVSIPEFTPSEAADYLTPEATLTVCRLLQELLRPSHQDSHDATLFQLNHVRILEPRPGESIFTKDGSRLFPKVDIIDYTAQVQLRMREKVALELAELSKEEFAKEAEKGGINFPVLSSVRVLVRKAQATTGHAADGAAEHSVSAIIVEAAEQDLAIPKAMPNASMTFLNELLKTLPPAADRMIVAPLRYVRRSPHAGMIVEDQEGRRHACGCVLSLVAHVGKSRVEDLAGGNRIASKECWDVPFTAPESPASGAPEHAEVKLPGELASYCTMDNVQYYSLSSRKGKEPVYAVVALASAHDSGNGLTIMVDKVHCLDKDRVPAVRSVFQKLCLLSLRYRDDGQAASTPSWEGEHTPRHAKKARRLSASPTDVDMP